MRILCFTILVVACSSCANNTGNKESITGKDISTADYIPVDPDSIAFSFVFMGCNRVDGKDTRNSNTNASTANIPELERTFNEIAGLNPAPAFYFFLGDEVLGLEKDTSALSTQLQAWKLQYANKIFSGLPASGIQLVAIPGNHEMLYETKTKKGKEEVPNKHATDTWINQMSSYMPTGVTINRVSGKDSLDNRMTYSFTYNNTHFILLNTDTYNKNGTIGMAPAEWIIADIVAAKKDPAVKHIFLLGHKPAIVSQPIYVYDGENTMDTSVVKAIWPVMDSNQVEAMLSAHSHQYDRLQPDSNMSYQVIAGNGGSPYEHKAAKDTARQFFGYTIVYIMKNQQVIVQSMGRSVPASNYLESISSGLLTTIRDQAIITWGTNSGTWNPDKANKKTP